MSIEKVKQLIPASEMENVDIKILDKLEKDLDTKLRHYMNFEILKNYNN